MKKEILMNAKAIAKAGPPTWNPKRTKFDSLRLSEDKFCWAQGVGFVTWILSV